MVTGHGETEREGISREISDVVDAKTTEAKEDARRRRGRGAYFWIIMVVYMVAGPAFAIWVSVENTHRSERKLCAVVVTGDDAYRQNPPVSPVGKRQAANMARLRHDFGCP